MVSREGRVAIGNSGVFYYHEDDRRTSYEARYVVSAILMLAIGLGLLLGAAFCYSLLIQSHRHV